MSTIKKKFNIWTTLMFVGCLALSIIITQPLLARADDEGGNDVIIDTTFSDTKSMALDTLDLGDSMNIGGNMVIEANGHICNHDHDCIKIDGDGIILNKMQIGNTNSEITFSGNKIIKGNQSYIIWDDEHADSITGEDLITYFMHYHTQYLLTKFGLFEGQEDNQFVADKNKPLFASKEDGYLISFKDPANSNIVCSEDNAGTLHYIENTNGSKLIMCMKMGDGTYSGVVLHDTAGLQ